MNSKYFVSWIVILVTIAWTRSNCVEAQQAALPPEVAHYADTIFYNGKVLTADEKFTTAEAVAIRDGKFLAVGTSERIRPMAGPHTLQVDLKGKTVIPGLLDLHQHPFTEGLASYWAQKYVPKEPNWDNAQQALEGIKRAVARAKPGESVIIPRIFIGTNRERFGTDELPDEAICDFMPIGEKFRSTKPCASRNVGNMCRVLTREQLDSVSPNNPLIFTTIGNNSPYAINSKAAEAIRPHLRDFTQIFEKEGSPCIRGGLGLEDGRERSLFMPAQLVQDYLMFWNEPLEEWLKAFRDTSQGFTAAGLTLTKEHLATPLLTGIRELWARGELTVRMRIPLPLTPMTGSVVTSLPPDQAETLFRRMGNLSGIGDDMLRFSGVRAGGGGGNLLRGSPWTLEPRIRAYTPRDERIKGPYGGGGPGEGINGPLKPGEEIFPGREVVVQAVRFGWDVSADHTVGDRIVREMLNAYEEGLQKQVVKRPGQKLHLGHTPFVALEDIQRMKKLGVIATIGPWHTFLPEMLEAGVMQFGTDRFGSMSAPMKSHIKEGLHPGLESDVPGGVFWRLEKAITRKDDKYHRIWNPGEAITRQEALWMSTLWSAQVIGEENKLGSIEPGKLADLVVLDKDYLAIPEDGISEIQTLLTMVGGKVVYEVKGALR